MSVERLGSILEHLKPVGSGLAAVTQKNPDDVVITLALRTPLTRGFKGGFKDTKFDYILYSLLKEVKARATFDTDLVEDICVGNVVNENAAFNARAAALSAGFPDSSGTSSVNRFCSSGLKSIQEIANQITTGNIDIGIAVGAESMTLDLTYINELHPVVVEHYKAAECYQPMGQTSENVSADFNIPRERQDRFAAESYRKAEVAQRAGWFDEEIVPVKTVLKDAKTGEEKTVVLTKDEGPRWGTTYESLSKIRPAFPKYGTTSTGGNSSQVTDGAAAVVLMKRSKAQQLKQPILAKFVAATVIGVPPRIMGIGPALAIPKLLNKLHLSKDDIDIVELNEAFASQALYCLDVLGLDHAKVNPRGGAISLGHPLGATGVRQVVTGLSEARRQGKKTLLTSMCVGTGQGMAGLFVNEAGV